jgi:RimJ/RimL family protein N-acetyltransferase
VNEPHTLRSVDDAEEYIRHKKVSWILRERLVPKIVEKSTGNMVGQLWIEPKWDRMIFEIGYFIEEKSQGRGYITESVKKIIKYLFNDLGANRLEIHTKATNSRSIAVANRCGFTKEAHLRERSRTNEGMVVDLCIFGLLRREYQG